MDWTAATVIKHLGPVTYLVREGDRSRTVHIDHMVPRRGEIKGPEQLLPFEDKGPPAFTSAETPPGREGSEQTPRLSISAEPTPALPPPSVKVDVPAVFPGFQTRRYPERLRSAPKRLDL